MGGVLSSVRAVVLVATALGCGPSKRATPAGDTVAVSTQVSSDSVEQLIAALRELPGTYIRSGGGAWSFSGDEELFMALSAAGEEAVRPLVDCLDDRTVTQVTVGDRPVPVGVLCYEALSRTVIYEATSPDGGLDSEWPGYLLPTASADELQAAQRAWQRVVEEKRYGLP